MICRVSVDKSRLVRVARMPDGTVVVDFSNKGLGRGTYVCLRDSCRQDPRLGPQMSRALRASVPYEALQSLQANVEEAREQSQ